MKKINKKGFTIVELVIVIGIIAILAAVLIPTFSNLVKKAQTSKDTQLIRNLNTALVVDKASGNTHNTMTDALQAAKEAGYLVDRINASNTDNEILWDSKNDVFCYLEKDATKPSYIPETTLTNNDVKDVDYWKISGDDADLLGKYSVYYTGTSTEIETTVGFDAGETSGITSVKYNRSNETVAQDVVIRTNSINTNLIINAPTDKIAHYDKVNLVEIIEVANHSYHEYGTTNKINLLAGNLVIESESKVQLVVVTASDASKVKLEVVNKNENNITITATNENVKNEMALGGDNFKIPTESVKNYNGITNSNLTIKDGVNILLEDIESTRSQLTINNGDNVILDLNGNTWKWAEQNSGRHYYAFANRGVFTLIDSIGNGKISARGVENFGTMYVNSGRIESIDSNGGGAAVWNEGFLYVSGGELAFTGERSGNNSGVAINNRLNAKAFVIGGIVSSKTMCIYNEQGYVEISNITINSTETAYFNAIKNFYGTMMIKNIIVTAKKGGCIENMGGKLVIENSKFAQAEYYDHNSNCISTNYGGETIIRNSEISAETVADGNNYCLYVYNTGGSIIVEGGYFRGGKAVLKADESNGLYCSSSDIIINDGTFVGEISIGSNNASLQINGGSFSVDPTSYVDTNTYEVTNNNDAWIVTKK